jgi:hypothetical protein
MSISWDEIYVEAMAFSKRHENDGQGKADPQNFVKEFLKVFGVDISEIPEDDGGFEYIINLSEGKIGKIDFFWKKKIAILMLSRGEDLQRALKQLKQYLNHIQDADMPELWLVCDFKTFKLFNRIIAKSKSFVIKKLCSQITQFSEIVGFNREPIRDDIVAVNVKAVEKLARLHEELERTGYNKQELQVYLVRLLFCLFAENTGVFHKNLFLNYIKNSKTDGSDLGVRLTKLFDILNMPIETRESQTLLTEELKSFSYLDGNLFKQSLHSPVYNKKMREMLLDCANFDWGKISPAIFGAMFQGVIDTNTRRKIGAHYTSEENILKVINPLIMDSLRKEFETVKATPKALQQFHNKICNLKFLDPACGCGNFLIIIYRELRLLELDVLKILITSKFKRTLGINGADSHKVGIDQFYGIEAEAFPCQIAHVCMWLMDLQMNMLASEACGEYYSRLNLSKAATIIHGNALTIDWEDVCPKDKMSFVCGNPPFIGSKMMTQSQREDMSYVFRNTLQDAIKGFGILDYVAAWYLKAASYIKGTQIRVSFVSTKSITQGEQVAILWKPLIQKLKIHIDFAWRLFKWDNEAKQKAVVICVILGFSSSDEKIECVIFDNSTKIPVKHINPYLVDAPDIFIERRQNPICKNIPELSIGNKPIDNGIYLFTDAEKDIFVKNEPQAKKYFKRFVGADELINGRIRWCLFLGECPPEELRKMPEALKLIKAVRQFRLSSKSRPTIKLADKPKHFHIENMPKTKYLAIPRVSSDKRNYIPMDFLGPNIIASDSMLILPGANLYHFGVLSSNVHMAWVKSVCGRLGMGYRYSKDIVYNNFPWPNPSDIDKNNIMTAAKHVLDIRNSFKNSTLADLYPADGMNEQLLKTHQTLDRAVMKAYKFDCPTEEKIVEKLHQRYLEISKRTTTKP